MKKFSRLFILVLFIVFLLKCATATNPLRKTVEIDEDLHEKAVAVLGIEKMDWTKPYIPYSFFIRSWIYKESGSVIHEICVSYSYTGEYWISFEKAYSQEGQPLQLTKIDSDWNSSGDDYGDYFYEEISVMITDEYLKKHLNGFTITISPSRGDSHIIELTPEQTILQLKKIQEYKKLHNL